MLSTDVVVVGGGVAGLLIASALAPEVSVVLLEQQDSFPRNKYWLTDEKAVAKNPHLQACIDRRYEFFDFVANDGLTATVGGSYCLWNTDLLVEHLAKELSVRGVQILTGHKFYSLAYGVDKIV